MLKRLTALAAVVMATGVAPLFGQQQYRIVPREALDSLANPVAAADSPMRFEKTRIDIGTISEDDKPSEYTLYWHNDGEVPLVITDIRTGCGCTTVKYDRRPVKKGEQGAITITYRPKGHPGRFQRKILVYTQLSDKASAVLDMSGNVLPSVRPTHDYPNVIGSLRLKQMRVRMRDSERTIESIEVMNAGSKPLKIEADSRLLPEYLTVKSVPERIEAGARGDIEISFDPARVKTTVRREIPIILNGIEDLPPSRRTIYVNFD